MAEIVNLRRVKKAHEAQARASAAQQNRVLHGRTKGEKARDRLTNEQAARRADNARLDSSKGWEKNSSFSE